MAEEFPFVKPEGSDAEMFIQWKGTDLCVDLDCACGGGGHYDGYGAYYLRCPDCEAVYCLGTQVILKRVEEVPKGSEVHTVGG